MYVKCEMRGATDKHSCLLIESWKPSEYEYKRIMVYISMCTLSSSGVTEREA
jgi:hypothetical protein